MNSTNARANHKSQRGITLLMSVFVLAAVSAISFSVAALVLREIRSSRILSQSEPSLIAAEGGAETALFFRIRGLNSYTNQCPSGHTGSLGGAGFTVCNDYYDTPYFFSTSSTTNEVLLLNDPANPANSAAGYSSLSITATSGSASVLQIRAYDLNSNNPVAIQTSLIVPGNVTLSGLNPNASYAVFLVPQSGSNPNPIANGSAIGNGGSKGIPSKNPSIISTGTRNTLIRRLEVQLNRQ